SSGIASALACSSGNSTPAASFAARARSSRACELSRPTGRAPAPASERDHSAAPQPSSSTSFPATSPSTCSSASGICHSPQARPRSMKRAFRSSYSALWPSQNSRFLRACSVRSGAFTAEPELELALRRFRRVRTVHQVVRHRERKVAADRPRSGLGRVGRAHRGADDRDRRLALERERKRRRRGDELDQLAEKRLLGVLGVVLLRELAVDLDEPRFPDLQPAALEAREDLAGQLALHRVGLDQHQCPLDRHRRRRCYALRSRRGGESAWVWPNGSTAVGSTGVSQYGQTCQSASSGCLQLLHDWRSLVVQTGQIRKAWSTSARQTGQCMSRRASRCSIALISSSRSRTSSRYSGGLKSM